jgi:hypothetical protein
MKVLRRIISLIEQATVTSWQLTWTNLSCRPHPLSRNPAVAKSISVNEKAASEVLSEAAFPIV